MDARTQWEIDKINASIPEHLKKHLIKKGVNQELENMRERLEYEAKRDPIFAKRTKRMRANFVNTSYEDVDYEIAKEIESYVKTKIEGAIREKRIPKATDEDYRRFLGNIHKK